MTIIVAAIVSIVMGKAFTTVIVAAIIIAVDVEIKIRKSIAGASVTVVGGRSAYYWMRHDVSLLLNSRA